ncbi:toxin-antitoxin system YwqK family antitoxin [uncultured Hymenobacter sp.]|uniref:toxin-antitoxin system YwqK family antitoxin n=1 Tax=uncultured Hymenobacter sp. TaxID=170016 RepID=UPI0035CB85C2
MENNKLASDKQTNVCITTHKNELKMTFITERDSNGVQNGLEKVLWSNGSLCRLGHYKNGKKDGRFISFFPFSKFRQSTEIGIDEIVYFKNDLADGRFYNFYENGHLEHIQDWKAGHISGNAYYFDTKQRLICIEHYGKNNSVAGYVCYDTLGNVSKRQGEITFR